MKYLSQAFLSIIIGFLLMSPTGVRASDDVKVTYKTAELASDVHTEKIDNRTIQLESYLKTHNSPMAGVAGHFVNEADRLGLDWKLVAAIAGNESYFGWYIPENSYNGWGWAVWTGMSYGAAFQNWEEGITAVSEGLKTDYIDQGYKTVEEIGGKYAADPQWAWKVQHFMNDIEAYDMYKDANHPLALAL